MLLMKQKSTKLIKWEKTNNLALKNRIYYFYNDIIDLKDFEPNLSKIDKKSYKNIDIYYIEYITINKINDESIYSVNHLHLCIIHASGYIEKK